MNLNIKCKFCFRINSNVLIVEKPEKSSETETPGTATFTCAFCNGENIRNITFQETQSMKDPRERVLEIRYT